MIFQAQGIRVRVAGHRSELSLPALATQCRCILVAVPIAATPDVIRAIGPHLAPESRLKDFTSLKEEPVREMLAAARAEVLGCHSLFTPDCPSLAIQTSSLKHLIVSRAAMESQNYPDTPSPSGTPQGSLTPGNHRQSP